MAEVEMQALLTSRSSLKRFEIKVENICKHSKRHSEHIIKAGREGLKTVEKEVQKSDELVRKLTKEKRNIENRIAILEAELATAMTDPKGGGRVVSILREIDKQKKRLEATERELKEEERRNVKLHNKLIRLRNLFQRMQSDAYDYESALRSFEINERERTAKGITAVRKCIDEIEQYLRVDI